MPRRSWPEAYEAAAKFVLENQHKRSIDDDVMHLKMLMPWIGSFKLDRIHKGSLEPWIMQRRSDGKAVGTINHGLKIVRRILNLSAGEWVDEQGLTWSPAKLTQKNESRTKTAA
jgi:hypothetical protein